MIKWICDICRKEIKSPEHPVKIVSYYSGMNRDLDGYGETIYLIKLHGHRDCAERLAEKIKGIVPSV